MQHSSATGQCWLADVYLNLISTKICEGLMNLKFIKLYILVYELEGPENTCHIQADKNSQIDNFDKLPNRIQNPLKCINTSKTYMMSTFFENPILSSYILKTINN